MDNEPVGYFLYVEEYKEWEEAHAGTPNAVPLYTHPKGFNWSDVNNEQLMNEVRSRGYIISNAQVSAHPVKEQLTEEQVIDITKAFFNIHCETNLTEKFNIPLYELTHFARAILRKAQEK